MILNKWTTILTLAGSGFRELTPFAGVRAGIVDPLEDNDAEMLISLNRRDRKVFDVYRINIYTGAMDLVYEHPEVDVSGLLRSKARKVITGVAFTTDKPGYEFFDPERRQMQEALEARLPGRRVAATGMSRDERQGIADLKRIALRAAGRHSRERSGPLLRSAVRRAA